MATEVQIEANRRNSRKSTGPKTEEGKNRSKFNALDHGCRANVLVLPTEDFGASARGQCLEPQLAATQSRRGIPRRAGRESIVAGQADRSGPDGPAHQSDPSW